MVNTLTKTSWPWSYPIVLFCIHIFSFPFNSCLICRRCRSNLNNFFLSLTLIREFSIRSESILIFFFLSLFFRTSNSVKSCILKRTRTIGRSINWFRKFFIIILCFFIVFFYPKFMICFVWFNVRNIKMGIMTSHSWWLSWIELGLLIEKSFISNFSFPCFHCLKLLFYLIFCFI